MADTADLIVLGAYYGTGNKGFINSIFTYACDFYKNFQRWNDVRVSDGLFRPRVRKILHRHQVWKRTRRRGVGKNQQTAQRSVHQNQQGSVAT